MDKNRPLTIWTPRQRPNNDPKFQNALILAGLGNSIKELLTIFNRGWDLKIDVMCGSVIAKGSDSINQYINLQNL